MGPTQSETVRSSRVRATLLSKMRFLPPVRPPILWLIGAFVLLLTSSAYLRLAYLWSLTDDPNRINFGGDACHHYNIAWNIAHGRGPFTDFIFSFWFHHPALPALTDIYPPGVHYVLGICLTLFGDGYGTARWTCFVFGSVACLIVYLLSRRFLGRPLSLLAAAIVALNPVH